MPAAQAMTIVAEEPVAVRGVSTRRRTVFLYQDAVVVCATVWALEELGILRSSLAEERSLADLYPEVSPGGFGYLRVGLRCLASQGWLADGPGLDPEATVLRWTDEGGLAARHLDDYVALGRLLAGFSSTASDAWRRPWRDGQVESFLGLVELAGARWKLDAALPEELQALLATHFDAALSVPVMLWLDSDRRLAPEGPRLPEGETGRGMERLLTGLGWVDGETGRWTASGWQTAEVAGHFGMAASYLPLFAELPDLYRGRLAVEPAEQSGALEWHVHRGLNVSASSAAHRRYFADADGIFLELFNRETAQPRFVADMGCGDGSWLVHLHRLVGERTRRGQRLVDDPLLMVGLDPNQAALDNARRVLDAAGVPALLIQGDVSDPDGVRDTLAEHGLAIEDGLHVRAFIDHNRTYLGGEPQEAVPGWSSGAYVDGQGQALDPAEVERDLVAHLRRWAPHIRKYGLVVLEAHCVAPHIAARHVGALHSIAFDAYHGYSHQYPVEYSAFLHCCREAGLQPASHCERRYPSTRPFVAVSLNRLLAAEPPPEATPARAQAAAGGMPAPAEAAPEGTWRPEPGTDLEDGQALHELLYVDGDLRYPRMWCSEATGLVVAGALEAIEGRLAAAGRGDVIRILDYGTGTGLAAIELLKACRERDMERELSRRGATLEVHLADVPSSWFAQGHELLGDLPETRFHSLRAADGRFRSLIEVTGGKTMDAVMANMVFHLIPLPALERTAAELASVMGPEGRLLWSAPDLGPPGQFAVLFHDPNRALRKHWLELLDGEPEPALEEAVRGGRALDDAARREAALRADRRILPQPHLAADVAAALDTHFGGRLELRTCEILSQDVLDTLLVPSNQAEYLAELEDRTLREEVVRVLMLEHVLPELQQEPAGTALGLNVQWTLGAFAPRPRMVPAA